MDTPFSAIHQSKVSEDIVEQIKGLIREGRLKPGEKLPSERRLAQMLEVGRSSLREAINSLSMMGLVEVKRRKGIYVRPVSTPLVTDPLRQIMDDDKKIITSLYDIRIDLEVASARIAATSRTEEQLAALQQRLDAIKVQYDENHYMTDNDLEFHSTIADATGNFLRVHIINEIFTVAGQYIKAALEKVVAKPGNIEAIYEQHKAIYDAIARKRSDDAGEAMLSHLQWVKDQLEVYL